MRRALLAGLMLTTVLTAGALSTPISEATQSHSVSTHQHGSGRAEPESEQDHASDQTKQDRNRRRAMVGVQFHGLWSSYTDRQRAEALTKIARMGAGWVRIDLSWAMLQPTRGPIDPDSWGVEFTDQIIEMAHARNLKVLGTLWLTPGWANDSRGERAAPASPSDYGKALAWAAARWRGKVQAWEVWNEPNDDNFFHNPDPRTYTKLLCAAYRAVNADPDSRGVRVVYGGTMQNDTPWIERTYRAGVKGCFDIMSTHPYQNPTNTGPLSGDGRSVWQFAHLRQVRKIMRRHHDHSPVWATEFGWSSHRNHGGEEPWEIGVSRRKQARYTVAAFRALREKFPFVRKGFIYTDREIPADGPHEAGFGILTYDLKPKPVYRAMQRWIRR